MIPFFLGLGDLGVDPLTFRPGSELLINPYFPIYCIYSFI